VGVEAKNQKKYFFELLLVSNFNSYFVRLTKIHI